MILDQKGFFEKIVSQGKADKFVRLKILKLS